MQASFIIYEIQVVKTIIGRSNGNRTLGRIESQRGGAQQVNSGRASALTNKHGIRERSHTQFIATTRKHILAVRFADDSFHHYRREVGSIHSHVPFTLALEGEAPAYRLLIHPFWLIHSFWLAYQS